MVEGFLLGVIGTASLAAALFFLKFWKQTHDRLFLAFATFFAIEAINRVVLLRVEHSNEGSPWIYLFRLLCLLVLLAAILEKNYKRSA
jgi:uncharacterized membrane protein HdeD (DUF308 family)